MRNAGVKKTTLGFLYFLTAPKTSSGKFSPPNKARNPSTPLSCFAIHRACCLFYSPSCVVIKYRPLLPSSSVISCARPRPQALVGAALVAAHLPAVACDTARTAVALGRQVSAQARAALAKVGIALGAGGRGAANDLAFPTVGRAGQAFAGGGQLEALCVCVYVLR